jgi:hypothetical protein
VAQSLLGGRQANMRDMTSSGSLGEGGKRIGVMSMEVEPQVGAEVTQSMSNGDL